MIENQMSVAVKLTELLQTMYRSETHVKIRYMGAESYLEASDTLKQGKAVFYVMAPLSIRNVTGLRENVLVKGCPTHLKVNENMTLLTYKELHINKNEKEKFFNLLLLAKFGAEDVSNSRLVMSRTELYNVWRVVAKREIKIGKEIIIQKCTDLEFKNQSLEDLL